MLTVESALSLKQQYIVEYLKTMAPKGFLDSCPDGPMKNFKILGMFQWALNDFNSENPRTGYTTGNLPEEYIETIAFGSIMYMEILKQAEMALVDISYSDGNLSLTIDRVGKIESSLNNFKDRWEKLIRKIKNNVLLANGGVGLGTVRYQGNLSKFITVLGGGSAMGWNIP